VNPFARVLIKLIVRHEFPSLIGDEFNRVEDKLENPLFHEIIEVDPNESRPKELVIVIGYQLGLEFLGSCEIYPEHFLPIGSCTGTSTS